MSPHRITPCFLAIALPETGPWYGEPAVREGRGSGDEHAARPSRTLTRLAQRCMRWTPRVHIELQHGAPALVLDLTGCLAVHGAAARTVQRVQRAFMQQEIPVVFGMAATAGAALAMSACDACTAPAGVLRVAPPQNPWSALDPLPLVALRLPPHTLEALLEVNVTTIGQLRAIERSAVADRYGPLPAQRMDTLDVHGHAWPFHPVAPPQRIAGEYVFASPCAQLEAVQRAMQHAVAQLCAELDRRVRGVSTMEVRVQRAHMRPVRGRLYFGAPTRSAAHLWSLLAPRVERMQLGCNEHGMGIERIELIALRLGSAQCDATQHAVGQLVDQLCARLGSAAVRGPIQELEADECATRAP